jgi:hypothetical protein
MFHCIRVTQYAILEVWYCILDTYLSFAFLALRYIIASK